MAYVGVLLLLHSDLYK